MTIEQLKKLRHTPAPGCEALIVATIDYLIERDTKTKEKWEKSLEELFSSYGRTRQEAEAAAEKIKALLMRL